MSVSNEQAVRLAEDYTAAWNSGSPEAVAQFYSADGGIVMKRGQPWTGRAGVAEMAAGFFADIPDLLLICEGVRRAADHIVYLWRFTGTHAATGTSVDIAGWEEWDIDENLKVIASRGWFDAAEYAGQTTAR